VGLTPVKRDSTKSKHHRRILAKGKPPCYWCGEPIAYDADWLDPLAYQVDHVIPLSKGGIDELVNPDGSVQKVNSHRACNRSKSNKMPLPAGATFITERNWS
jgi:5-methylcytosine-specific restriction endonuclease McrA